jgi:hypothetical protein
MNQDQDVILPRQILQPTAPKVYKQRPGWLVRWNQQLGEVRLAFIGASEDPLQKRRNIRHAPQCHGRFLPHGWPSLVNSLETEIVTPNVHF